MIKKQSIQALKVESACEHLPWDSEFFGSRIARVRGDTLNKEKLKAITDFCHEEKIDCVYFLANSQDANTAYLAEKAGFHLTDIRLTLSCHIQNRFFKENTVIRPVIPSEIPQLSIIARESFRHSRFHFDKNFSTKKADELYQIWIEKGCAESHVLVAESEGQPAGFVSLEKHQDYGQISLISVGRSFMGKGIGKDLVGASLKWCLSLGLTNCHVVTQARNITAQRLYQSNGFLTEKVELWYHRWKQNNVHSLSARSK